MNPNRTVSRRAALKTFGAFGTGMLSGQLAGAAETPPPSRKAPPPVRPAAARAAVMEKVAATPLIDTHEHLPEESARTDWKRSGQIPCDDWALLLSHYLNSDLASAGMPKSALERLFSPEVDPGEKWPVLEPYWAAVKNTGYGQAVRRAVKKLYGVDDLSAGTVGQVQRGYERLRKPGFYQQVLRDAGGIESCQVNSLSGEPFRQSVQPELLMQDISIVGLFSGPALNSYGAPAGIAIKELGDWHRVIDWWFDRYGAYAVAVKSQNAYSRDIDYARVPEETAAPVFRKIVNREPASAEERKQLEDHLFWRAVDKAAAAGLPVKLHTGYYAGHNSMPLSRLQRNAGSATELCRLAPDAQFVFMHICYPYYEELLSVAKQWSNAHVDMCWSWIINPVAAKDYVKKHLVTAPANKLLTFGGDYIPVEPVVGHAEIARRGIGLALAELVEEGWFTLADALEAAESIMNGNARRIFQLDKKVAALKTAPWLK